MLFTCGARSSRSHSSFNQKLSSLRHLEVALFPDWETLPYDSFSPHQEIISDRIARLYTTNVKWHHDCSDQHATTTPVTARLLTTTHVNGENRRSLIHWSTPATQSHLSLCWSSVWPRWYASREVQFSTCSYGQQRPAIASTSSMTRSTPSVLSILKTSALSKTSQGSFFGFLVSNWKRNQGAWANSVSNLMRASEPRICLHAGIQRYLACRYWIL